MAMVTSITHVVLQGDYRVEGWTSWMNVSNWLVVFAFKEQIHAHKQFTNLNKTYTQGDSWTAMVASVPHVVSPVMSLPVAMEAEWWNQGESNQSWFDPSAHTVVHQCTKYYISSYISIIQVCLFVCDRLLNYGMKRLQTFTDYVEPTQECPPVVKVVRLAVLCAFTFCFQVSLCKHHHIIGLGNCSLYCLIQISRWRNLFQWMTCRFVAKQCLHDFLLHLPSWQNESVNCPRTLLQHSKHALQELSKAPGVILATCKSWPYSIVNTSTSYYSIFRKCYLKKFMLIVIMVQRRWSQNTCFYFMCQSK